MSRFWRWLIIILVIYIIVHIVLWIVGFFVAKSLPKGVMLKIRIHEDVTRKLVRPSVTRVNVDVGEIIKWHLMRFIPFKELTNQPERSIYGIKLCVNKSGTQVMIVPKGLIPGSIPKRTGNLTYKTYIDYETKCGKINAKSGNPNFAKEIITADFIKLIKLKKPYVANTSVGVSKTYYAKKKDGKICEVYVFIRTTKY